MKKIVAILLAVFVVFSLAACGGGGSSVTLAKVCDDNEAISATATVGYSGSTKVDDYMLEDEDAAQLINEEKNFSVELYLYYDNGYDSYKDLASTSEGYKEVKYSGFDGYMYQYDEFEYEICLKLADEEDGEVFLFAYVAPGSQLIDTEKTDMEEIFNQTEVQDILNSIKYKGTKEVKGE